MIRITINGNEIDIHTGMVIDQSLAYIDIVAAGDLQPYRYVGYDLKHPNVESRAIGVTEGFTAEGDVAKIRYGGIGLIQVANPINRGDKLGCDLEGKAKKVTGSTIYNGVALDFAENPDDIIRILLTQ